MTPRLSIILLLNIACCSIVFYPLLLESNNSITSEHDEHAEQISDGNEQQNSPAQQVASTGQTASPIQPIPIHQRIIEDIIICGNKYVPDASIRSRLPIHIGERFDPRVTRELINKLYFDLKRLRDITVSVEPIEPDRLVVYIDVEEKIILKDVRLEGNSQISTKDIDEKINFSELIAVDREELPAIASRIQQLYAEKGYHSVEINTDLEIDSDGRGVAIFTIIEHPKSVIKRILFTGNECIDDKTLRSVMFSREDWILGFLDKSGIYQKERLEADRQMIEQYYQNQGYLTARVTDVDEEIDECNNFTITFHIQEGPIFYIDQVRAPGNDLVSEEFILCQIPVQPGDKYSRENIVNTIKMLESLWGDFGYIFSNINPIIIPDEESCTVSITFESDLGDQVYLNQINIKGNKKTRDRIIRRQIVLEEGDLISTTKMEWSKNRVESLGYFEVRDGVNWNINRIDNDKANLDLIVNETKTGNASIQLGLGGSDTTIASPLSGFSAEVNLSDTNLFGEGIRTNLSARFSKEEKSLQFNLTEPWLFNKPIFGAFDAYHIRYAYDEFSYTQPVNERHSGGSLKTGMTIKIPHRLIGDTFIRGTFGFEGIGYERRPIAAIRGGTPKDNRARAQYNALLAHLFDPGHFGWMSLEMGQDTINHPIHPSKGQRWLLRAHVGIPAPLSQIGFYKFDMDYHWFTPLIGSHDLVFHVRSYMGFVQRINNRNIPYAELFHIGGLQSVRGFLYGEIGPQFVVHKNNPDAPRDSIGASRAFWVSGELLFPITPDLNLKGVVFYDGGAGWKNPYARDTVSNEFIERNGIDYRHAVGVGIRMLNPMPVRIDWGFKLDKRTYETRGHEVHFSMDYNW